MTNFGDSTSYPNDRTTAINESISAPAPTALEMTIITHSRYSFKTHGNLVSIVFIGMSPFKALYGYDSTIKARLFAVGDTATPEQAAAAVDEIVEEVRNLSCAVYFLVVRPL